MSWPKILDQPLSKTESNQLAEEYFGDMIKLVVDIEGKILAAGGSLHADAEQLLLQHGSKQADIWGANYFPDRMKGEKIEYTALINIRPNQGNRNQNIQSNALREKMKSIISRYFEL